MNIGIDIDGCLMDFTNFTWNGMPLYLKRHNIAYNPIDYPVYSFAKQFNLKKELTEIFWTEEECENMYLSLPPRPYTKEILDYFKSKGHKLYIITARSNTKHNKNLIEKTYSWLEKHGLFFDGIYFDTGNKVDIINELKIDFMLEDSPENILAIAKNTSCKVFCFDSFCNGEIQDDVNIIRVFSMLDFKEKVDREIKTPRTRKKVLLVIDLQQEFKDKKGKYNEILKYIKDNKNNYDQIIATRFINGNDNFKKYLDYNFPTKISPLEFNTNIILDKKGYGLDNYNQLPKYYDYDIIGCETDACILKIAYDLFDREYNFNILKDYIYSNGNLHKETLKILERNLKCLK